MFNVILSQWGSAPTTRERSPNFWQAFTRVWGNKLSVLFLVSFQETHRKICWDPCLCWGFLQNSPEKRLLQGSNGTFCRKIHRKIVLENSPKKKMLENSPEKFVGKLTGKFGWKTHRKILLENSPEKVSWLTQGTLSKPSLKTNPQIQLQFSGDTVPPKRCNP